MASGTLGQAALTAATNTTVYTVPAGKVATVNVNILNRDAAPCAVRLAVAAAATPTTGEWIEYDAVIDGQTPLERTGLVVTAGKLIVAYSSNANTTVNVYGYED